MAGISFLTERLPESFSGEPMEQAVRSAEPGVGARVRSTARHYNASCTYLLWGDEYHSFRDYVSDVLKDTQWFFCKHPSPRGPVLRRCRLRNYNATPLGGEGWRLQIDVEVSLWGPFPAPLGCTVEEAEPPPPPPPPPPAPQGLFLDNFNGDGSLQNHRPDVAITFPENKRWTVTQTPMSLTGSVLEASGRARIDGGFLDAYSPFSIEIGFTPVSPGDVVQFTFGTANTKTEDGSAAFGSSEITFYYDENDYAFNEVRYYADSAVGGYEIQTAHVENVEFESPNVVNIQLNGGQLYISINGVSSSVQSNIVPIVLSQLYLKDCQNVQFEYILITGTKNG